MDTTILNVNQVNQIIDDIKIYPNPANDRLMINVGTNGNNYKVTITNQFGQLAKSLATNHAVAISTIDLQQGIYFVRIESENKQNKVFKVVIAR